MDTKKCPFFNHYYYTHFYFDIVNEQTKKGDITMVNQSEEAVYSIAPDQYEDLKRRTNGKSVRENLLEIRDTNQLTQRAVSEKIEINRETYSNYEKGSCNVPSDTILRLSEMYEIPIDLIFGKTESSYVRNFYENN